MSDHPVTAPQGLILARADGQLVVAPDVMLQPALCTSGPHVRLTPANVHYRLEGLAPDSTVTFDLSGLDHYLETHDPCAVFTCELIIACEEDMPLCWDTRLGWTNDIPPSLTAGRTWRIAIRYEEGRLLGNASFYTALG